MPYYSLERYSGCKKFEFAQVVKYNITTLKELDIFCVKMNKQNIAIEYMNLR